jgi:bifunctional isochorismate lyase/aryl carrier protein
MKEEYFTSKNISLISKEMLEIVQSNKIKKLRKKINIYNASLIVIDMQKYFTKRVSHAFIPSSNAIIPRIKKLVKLFLAKNNPVIFTRHIDRYYKNNMLLKWWRDRIRDNDDMSFIDERLKFHKTYEILKSQYDSFYGTELQDILIKNKIKKVFICGVVANLCCETTARSAFVRGYEVYFGIDTTAAYSFKHHIATLINISYGFGIPFMMEDLVNEN